ncbi:hypothetical protein OX283_006430 [Flavobacterium sp. SUN052]|uniref:hypothetical protein n=1 Tax=Flavobacterium sp. SUN052 TaxID=3002441 RepID=UPI00237E93C4|nr:hypothetical protein [Flavobacterium sp. SUN052]MEC4004285.1 hypothetical protein [Flavobacterium sp. SUN052]
MSERWKYQLKIGGFWGIFMTALNVLVEIKEKSLYEQLTSSTFYLRLVVYTLVGVLVLGYFNWKSKEKTENSNK